MEHVDKNGKPMLYLVFEYLDTDLKKFIDSHRRGPNPRPLPPQVIQVPFLLTSPSEIELKQVPVSRFRLLGFLSCTPRWIIHLFFADFISNFL